VAGLVLAAVGGALAWGVIEGTSPVFTVPREYDIPDLGAPNEMFDALHAVQVRVNRNNAVLELTWLSVLVAGMIAVGEAVARRGLKPLLVAVPVAAAGGGVAGFVGSLAWETLGAGPPGELTETVQVQVVLLGMLGVGVGLAVGLSSGSLPRVVASAVAGLGAGILAGVVYPVAISLLLPTASTDSLVPKGAVHRLLWIEITAATLGLFVTWALVRHRSARPRRKPRG
jgi:hypothetical protein